MMMLLRMEVRNIKMTLDGKIEKGDGDDGYGVDGHDDNDE